MRKIRSIFILGLLISFGLFSFYYLNKKSSDEVPEKAVLVMKKDLKSNTIIIIK